MGQPFPCLWVYIKVTYFTRNIIDRWHIAKTNRLVKCLVRSMSLLDFLDPLMLWYAVAGSQHSWRELSCQLIKTTGPNESSNPAFNPLPPWPKQEAKPAMVPPMVRPKNSHVGTWPGAVLCTYNGLPRGGYTLGHFSNIITYRVFCLWLVFWL